MTNIKLNMPASEADVIEANRQCPVCGDVAGWCPGPTSDVGCTTWRTNAPLPIEGPEYDNVTPDGWGL